MLSTEELQDIKDFLVNTNDKIRKIDTNQILPWEQVSLIHSIRDQASKLYQITRDGW